MHGLMEIKSGHACKRRPRVAAKAIITCENLEARSLLAAGFGLQSAIMGGMGFPGSRAAYLGSVQAGKQFGFFGRGSLGLGGGIRNPSLLLTAPLLEGGTGSTAPPSASVFSSSAVGQAFQTLQSDLQTDVPSGARPTHASVGALEDDLGAIRKGTLSGTAAQTKIEADQAAILTSMGLTQAQVSQIQSDQQAIATAIQTATTAAASSTSNGTTTAAPGSSTTAGSSSSSGSAVQSALQTLQTDFNSDNPSGSQPTHASVGAVEDDLDAIRMGTLSSSAAVTQVQTDAAAVLASMGMTSAQITQIQADQAAVATALQASAGSSTSATSGASSESTLQSVSPYLLGLPGVSSVGMRDLGSQGMGPGWGGIPRGGFGNWR